MIFLSISVWIWCIFSTSIVFISSRKQQRQRICSLLNVFNILSRQVFRKVHKNCIKYQKFDFFVFLSISVQIWCISSTSIAFISSKKQPRQRICSLLNVFKFLRHQDFRKVHKNCIKFSIIRIFGIFVSFGLNLMHFFNINCSYLSKETTTTTNLFLTERLQHSKPPSLSKSTQKLHKISKIWFFCIFVNFGVNLMHFFNINCFYLVKETTTTTNLFPTERLQNSKTPSLSKSTQKLHKISKFWFFLYFCQFRSQFDAFFQHQLLLSLQRSNHDNEFVLYWTSSNF